MTKRLTRVSPLQLGIVLAVLYGALGLIFVPFILLASLLGAKAGHGGFAPGVFLMILIPIFYAILGFIGGLILALVYNMVATCTGGIEFTFSDVA